MRLLSFLQGLLHPTERDQPHAYDAEMYDRTKEAAVASQKKTIQELDSFSQLIMEMRRGSHLGGRKRGSKK